MLYVRINVPTIGVPKNPEGLQPLAKLHKEEIVLFENGSIAEIRKTTADSIDASPYHFVYTRPEDIQTPHLSDVIPIDNHFKNYYYFINVFEILLMLAVFGVFLQQKTDFNHYFPDAKFTDYAIFATVLFSPEIIGRWLGKSSQPTMTIQKHSRVAPHTLIGKSWFESYHIELMVIVKIGMLWTVLFYESELNFSDGSVDFCWGILLVLTVGSSIDTIWKRYRRDYIKVEWLTLPEFHEKTVEVINSEMKKRPKEKKNLEELFLSDEGATLEFKSSVWTTYHRETGVLITEADGKSSLNEDKIVRTVAGFLNADGGTLIVGVQDRPTKKVVGIHPDYKFCGEYNKNSEGFTNAVQDLLRKSATDETIMSFVSVKISKLHGKDVCVISVRPRQPKKWTWVTQKTKPSNKKYFWVRSGCETREIVSAESQVEWIQSDRGVREDWDRWGDEEE